MRLDAVNHRKNPTCNALALVCVQLVVLVGASYDFMPMKGALRLLTLLLLCVTLRAQAPLSASAQPPVLWASGQQPATQGAGQPPSPNTQQPAAPSLSQYAAPGAPVPLSAEPHHRLVLQNEFVHVYNVMVPPLDATLLHQHDLPYLYITLGTADIVNAVVGQPEVRMSLQDGEVRYNPGHFAHLVRTDSGLPFYNITIELPRTQGTAHNLCKEVLPGQPPDCPREAAAAKKTKSAAGDDSIPYFETDEVRVDLVKVSSGRDYLEEAPKMNALLVALTDANLDAHLGGQHLQFLHGGDILWMPGGVRRRVLDFLGTQSSFLLVWFKDSPQPATP